MSDDHYLTSVKNAVNNFQKITQDSKDNFCSHFTISNKTFLQSIQTNDDTPNFRTYLNETVKISQFRDYCVISEFVRQFNQNQIRTVKRLIDFVQSKQYVLFSSPTFSGLFQQVRDYMGDKCIALSFAQFTGKSYQDLDRFFVQETGKSINGCLYGENPSQRLTYLILDETQNIYKIERFWLKFKNVLKQIDCFILAFATNDASPPVFGLYIDQNDIKDYFKI